MEVTGIITALVIGLMIGALGRPGTPPAQGRDGHGDGEPQQDDGVHRRASTHLLPR